MARQPVTAYVYSIIPCVRLFDACTPMLLSGKSFRKPCTGCKNNVEYKQRISLILTQLRSSKPKMCICVEKLNQRGREEEEEEGGGNFQGQTTPI